LNENICSSCGRPFDTETHKITFVHPNLFGGIDKLCRSCVRHEEEVHNRRTGKARSSRKTMVKTGINKVGE
jgi:hypothetical protein